ncbi:TIGR03899 family protein [Photobacterium sp. SDRW27]|uniref:TIGR03899 family protein n=1 Tax=Photobacterium obscurum TaxID=2829490 RepID=UPI002243B553|nr:TIGR03899 family protein [Photobacterium obscurum]MCW8330276.1 TIGR03899 family protein [Photobacterium obscurum]
MRSTGKTIIRLTNSEPIMSNDNQDAARSPEKHSKGENNSHIKSCQARTKELASQYAIDHLISGDQEKDITERTLLRNKRETQRQQENLERIFKLAYDSSNDKTAGDPDPDWLYHFISIAKNIHGAAMQRLWSQILKQEVSTPGSTSLKALDTLKNMTNREAQTFHRACMLACHFGNDHNKKLLTSIKVRHGILSLLRSPSNDKLALGNYQLPYSNLLVLMDLGLLLRSELESGEITLESSLAFGYQGTHYLLKPVKKGITLTYYRLSPTGQEIAKLLGMKNHEPYKESLLELLSKHFIVEKSDSSQVKVSA